MKSNNWFDHLGPEGGEAVPVDALGKSVSVKMPEKFSNASPDMGENVQNAIDSTDNKRGLQPPVPVDMASPPVFGGETPVK